MMIDVILDLAFGDCGKGAVCVDLLKKREYSHCMRYNGSQNAGHTVYIDGQKAITHMVPSGALLGVPSFIGSECYLHPKKLLDEINSLSAVRSDIHSLIKIAKNTHIITDSHLEEEAGETRIGTTRQGVGPCARDKYARSGIRAQDVPELQEFIVDTYQEFYEKNPNSKVLCEGAQSVWLDISFGQYPYVTSSHCGIGAVLNNGFSHKDIGTVFGVVKAYDTYVGARQFQDDSDPVLSRLCDVGQEYGSTTGRRRQVNYFNITMARKAADISGTDIVIMKKCDILKEVGVYRIIQDDKVVDLGDWQTFKDTVLQGIGRRVIFSETPHGI